MCYMINLCCVVHLSPLNTLTVNIALFKITLLKNISKEIILVKVDEWQFDNLLSHINPLFNINNDIKPNSFIGVT